MPDTVAPVAAILIGRVLTGRPSARRAVGVGVGAGQPQERSRDIVRQRAHAHQTGERAPSQPAHHERLDLIVTRVADTDALRPNGMGDLPQKRIARLPPRSFDSMTRPTGQLRHIAFTNSTGQPELPGERRDPGGVRACFLAPQSMVQMRDHQRHAGPAERLQDPEEA